MKFLFGPFLGLSLNIAQALEANMPKTLLEYADAEIKQDLKNSALILIDYQNEYLNGTLPLYKIFEAVEDTKILLELARKTKIPVIHVVHRGKKNSLFDPDHQRGKIIAGLDPIDGEEIVEKNLPNSFANTKLEEVLHRVAKGRVLLISGLMTHMCLSSTVRSALDHGYKVVIIASTTTTRDLKGIDGNSVPAQTIKSAELAALKDRFALILNKPEDLLK